MFGVADSSDESTEEEEQQAELLQPCPDEGSGLGQGKNNSKGKVKGQRNSQLIKGKGKDSHAQLSMAPVAETSPEIPAAQQMSQAPEDLWAAPEFSGGEPSPELTTATLQSAPEPAPMKFRSVPVDDKPGMYKVLKWCSVQGDISMDSDDVDEVDAGLFVTVLELAFSEVDRAVRAQVEDPHGWITLLDAETGERFASRVPDEAASGIE